jgi:hypothetical protein
MRNQRSAARQVSAIGSDTDPDRTVERIVHSREALWLSPGCAAPLPLTPLH